MKLEEIVYVDLISMPTFYKLGTKKEQENKLLEESNELFMAMRSENRERVLSEMADVIQVLCNIAKMYNCTDLTKAQNDCMVRNEKRCRYHPTVANRGEM